MRTLASRVSILQQFGTFTQTHGAQGYAQLPAHLEPFLHFWIHQPHLRQAPDRPPQAARHVRIAIEQMLRVAIPGFVGRPRRQATREPFWDRAPGFSSYLRDERGLRDVTLDLYDEHRRAFAAYLIDLGREDLEELSPVVVSGFLSERSQSLSRSTVRFGARCSACFCAICTANG